MEEVTPEMLNYLKECFGVRSVEKITATVAMTLLQNAQNDDPDSRDQNKFDKVLFNAYAKQRQLLNFVPRRGSYWDVISPEWFQNHPVYLEYIALFCSPRKVGGITKFGEYLEAVTGILASKHGWKAPFRMFINRTDLFDVIFDGFLCHDLTPEECAAEVNAAEEKGAE